MAKEIKITDACINKWREEFENILQSAKLADGKVNFSRSLTSTKRPCTVYFNEIAWLKMQALIRECDKEVGWHGIAYRDEDMTKDAYYITDILVYPQEVSAATVNTDQIKYQMWLANQDDEVFNNLRMQGHSHVNMGVTPSATDTDLYESLLSQLDDTMFYIFMIYNKRGEYTYKIYDMAKNIMFETSDVTVRVIEDELGVEKFLREAKGMVTDKPAYVAPTYNYGYSNYGGVYNKPAVNSQLPQVKPVQQVKPVETVKQETKKVEPEKKQKDHKWKRIEKKKSKKTTPLKKYGGYYYDDLDDPYGPFGYME